MHLFCYGSQHHTVRTNQPDKSPANRKERTEAAKKELWGGETDSGVWFCGNLWVVTLLCENKKLMGLKTSVNERT